MQPQPDEQRKKRALRLDSPGIHQQSRERWCGWSIAGHCRLSGKLDFCPDSTELGQRNSFHQCRVCRSGADSLGWWKVESGAQ